MTARRPPHLHVGINAHLLSGEAGYRRAGIHHYIAQVLLHLPLNEGLDYTIFTRQKLPVTNYQLPITSTGWPTEHRLVRILWEQVAWPWAAVRHQLDLLHSMAFVTPLASPCPTVVTVYDLSFIHYPNTFPAGQRRYLTSQTARSCRQARRVITISESGRQDVHSLLGVPLERIEVVRPGVDATFYPRPAAEVEAFRQRQGLNEPFILHVGTLQPRKNIPLLLEALAQMGRPGLRLVLVGGKGWLYDDIFQRVERLGLSGRVHWAGYVADEELPLWYNAAAVLVFPSAYEGFGMPVAQAMACGAPVVAADVSAIPEAAGEAALLFPPQDVEALAGQMAAVLDDPTLAATLRERGIVQASRFTWAEAGRQTVEVYKRALAGD
ncbi:MAG: glycosyltransferase family 1 protein [Chloroflexota bacterium]